MISALLSNFDLLTPAQRASVTHWIIDDPDRQPSTRPSTADFLHDIETERHEGYAYDINR